MFGPDLVRAGWESRKEKAGKDKQRNIIYTNYCIGKELKDVKMEKLKKEVLFRIAV